jgi:hypothetical protein
MDRAGKFGTYRDSLGKWGRAGKGGTERERLGKGWSSGQGGIERASVGQGWTLQGWSEREIIRLRHIKLGYVGSGLVGLGMSSDFSEALHRNMIAQCLYRSVASDVGTGLKIQMFVLLLSFRRFYMPVGSNVCTNL